MVCDSRAASQIVRDTLLAIYRRVGIEQGNSIYTHPAMTSMQSNELQPVRCVRTEIESESVTDQAKDIA